MQLIKRIKRERSAINQKNQKGEMCNQSEESIGSNTIKQKKPIGRETIKQRNRIK